MSGAYGGVNTTTRLLAVVALFISITVVASAGDKSLEQARRAQALLGSDVWSQVIRVENRDRTAHYPRVVHALVFEFADMLWFYTSSEGTQSFSLHRGRLAEEKADFAPLLREIHPGFTKWTVEPGAPAVVDGNLRNGCFIESVVALRDRLLRGGETVHPRLLSYYVITPEGQRGHTVLTYEAGGRVEVIDSAQTGKPFTFPATVAGDALKLAREFQGPEVSSARLFPIDWPAVRAGRYTTLATPGAALATSG